MQHFWIENMIINNFYGYYPEGTLLSLHRTWKLKNYCLLFVLHEVQLGSIAGNGMIPFSWSMICILCYTITPELICIYHFFPSLHICLKTVKTMKFELVAWNSSGDNPEPLTLLFGRTWRLSSGCFLVWKSGFFFASTIILLLKEIPTLGWGNILYKFSLASQARGWIEKSTYECTPTLQENLMQH